MKKLICLFLATLFLLCGCQAAVQQEPTQTEAPAKVNEYYFYTNPCDCWADPGLRYSGYPNYKSYTTSYKEVQEELKGSTKIIDGVEFQYEYTDIYRMTENANHEEKDTKFYDRYVNGESYVDYYYGTEAIKQYYNENVKHSEQEEKLTEEQLRTLAETFMKEVVDEEVLANYQFREFTKIMMGNKYKLVYIREFPETQMQDFIATYIDLYGTVTYFGGPALMRMDQFTGKITITEQMKEDAYAGALKIMEELGLQNVEVLETRYLIDVMGTAYMYITFTHDLEVPDYVATSDGAKTESHEETWKVNVN